MRPDSGSLEEIHLPATLPQMRHVGGRTGSLHVLLHSVYLPLLVFQGWKWDNLSKQRIGNGVPLTPNTRLFLRLSIASASKKTGICSCWYVFFPPVGLNVFFHYYWPYFPDFSGAKSAQGRHTYPGVPFKTQGFLGPSGGGGVRCVCEAHSIPSPESKAPFPNS